MESDNINLFATLYGENNYTEEGVICEPKNRKRHVPGQPLLNSNELRRQRSNNASKTTTLENQLILPLRPTPDRLELSFDHLPQSTKGLILGSDCECDIVLPVLPCIEPRHCAITFDDEGHLTLRDLGSKARTSVSYERKDTKTAFIGYHSAMPLYKVGDADSAEGQSRSSFTWILSDNAFIKNQQPNITICIGSHIRLRIVPVDHAIDSSNYLKKTHQFRGGCKEAAGLLNAQRYNQHMSAGAKTKTEDPIFVQSRVGEGAFGKATHYWNVSSGEVYVVKTSTEKNPDRDLWRQETTALLRSKHVSQRAARVQTILLTLKKHITYCFGSMLIPDRPPQLWLEYVPGGSLLYQCEMSPITQKESLSILRQCLSALHYLHHELRLAHRDIKPGNVLVVWRNAGFIEVKLGDFGLAKEGMNFDTGCGTEGFMAPEIKGKNSGSFYGVGVDLFALGAMVASFLVIDQGAESVRRLLKHRSNEEDSLDRKRFLLIIRTMLSKDPIKRGTAAKRWKEAEALDTAAFDESIKSVHMTDERSPSNHKNMSLQEDVHIEDAPNTRSPITTRQAPGNIKSLTSNKDGEASLLRSVQGMIGAKRVEEIISGHKKTSGFLTKSPTPIDLHDVCSDAKTNEYASIENAGSKSTAASRTTAALTRHRTFGSWGSRLTNPRESDDGSLGSFANSDSFANSPTPAVPNAGNVLKSVQPTGSVTSKGVESGDNVSRSMSTMLLPKDEAVEDNLRLTLTNNLSTQKRKRDPAEVFTRRSRPRHHKS